jgi:hypothetical protein
MFWNNSLNIDILGYSQYHIDTFVFGLSDDQWRLTTIYGEAQTFEWHQTWNMLKDICTNSTLPWLCIRDFNEVLRADEHEGIGTQTHNQIQGFREVVDVCNQMDLGFKGHFWTWEKKVTGGTCTHVRLDRALGSVKWSSQFPLASITHEDIATSDHCALVLCLTEEVIQRKKPPFRFETMWKYMMGSSPR